MAVLGSVILQGLLAALPTDNNTLSAGRIYLTTDTYQEFRDNGTTWVEHFPQGPLNSAGYGGFFGFTEVLPAARDTAVVVGSNNQVRVAQMRLSRRYQIAQVTVQPTNATVSGVADAGIYDTAGNLLAHTAGIDCSAALVKNTALTGTVTLPPGFYWYAWTVNNSAITAERITMVTSAQSLITKQATRLGTAANAATAGILPATLGTITASAFNVMMAYFER